MRCNDFMICWLLVLTAAGVLGECDTTWMLQSSADRRFQENRAVHRNASSVSKTVRSLDPRKAVVFYNLFIKATDDIPRVSKFVRQQLSHLDQHHQLWINSIGVVKDIRQLSLDPVLSNTVVFRHYPKGYENLTLHDAWSYCRRAPASSIVVYLHSKGSFHSHWPGQEEKREYLTVGALSKECLEMPQSCNVCSSRMSPLPSPHTPGNMWAARCGYLSKLIDPMLFEAEMNRYFQEGSPSLRCNSGNPNNGKEAGCVGTGRFSNEHWVQSHPQVQPCDLDINNTYTWGWPQSAMMLQAVVDFPQTSKVLSTAPRFDLAAYERPLCGNCGKDMNQRLEEYEFLYQEAPPATWWGWKFA